MNSTDMIMPLIKGLDPFLSILHKDFVRFVPSMLKCLDEVSSWNETDHAEKIAAARGPTISICVCLRELLISVQTTNPDHSFAAYKLPPCDRGSLCERIVESVEVLTDIAKGKTTADCK